MSRLERARWFSRAGLAVALGLVWLASGTVAAAEALTVLPLRVHVAEVRDAADVHVRPTRDAAWVDQQVAEANRLMAPAGVTFDIQTRLALHARHARLETRADRDALGRLPAGAAIDVFIVESLRDVDEPERLRMGVHWRRRSNRSRHYVILASTAGPTVLAHELGHYFGNPHTDVVDNVMSYSRADPAKLSFDEKQLGRIRRGARAQVRGTRPSPAAPVF